MRVLLTMAAYSGTRFSQNENCVHVRMAEAVRRDLARPVDERVIVATLTEMAPIVLWLEAGPASLAGLVRSRFSE